MDPKLMALFAKGKSKTTESTKVDQPVQQVPVAESKPVTTKNDLSSLLAKYTGNRSTTDAKSTLLDEVKRDNVTHSRHAATTTGVQSLLARYANKAVVEVPTQFKSAIESKAGVVIENESTDEPTARSVRVEKHELTYDKANPQQRMAVDYAVNGKSFVLIGSAGSGKTATQNLVTQFLESCGRIRTNHELVDHKHIPNQALNILICTFINRAANNIRVALQPQFRLNVVTIHKALEYAPTKATREALDEHGNSYQKEYMSFEPRRDADNPLAGIDIVIIEEGSTVSLELAGKLLNALPDQGANTQIIILGDLKQIPPVFGTSILAQKLLTLPVVELTTIYRTAEDSPIKSFAIAINEGKPISDKQLKEQFQKQGELEFYNLSGKRLDGTYVRRESGDLLVLKLRNYFVKQLEEKEFVPFRDIILCPHRENKRDDINCDHLNILLAEYEGQKRNAEVFEVIAGIKRKYLAIGDPVIYQKNEYTIVNIIPNPKYRGIPAKLAHTSLNRHGQYTDSVTAQLSLDAVNTELMAMTVAPKEEEEEEVRTTAASHKIVLAPASWDAASSEDVEAQFVTIEASTAGEVGSIEFAYATTPHKAIGSEWEKVWCIFHYSMRRMCTRELVYTAVTRAKSFLGIFYDGHDHSTNKRHSSIIEYAITHPEIKGVTLEEKLEWLRTQEKKATENPKQLLSQFTQVKPTTED